MVAVEGPMPPTPRDSVEAVPERSAIAGRGALRRASAATRPAACGRPAADPTPAYGRSRFVFKTRVIEISHRQ